MFHRLEMLYESLSKRKSKSISILLDAVCGSEMIAVYSKLQLLIFLFLIGVAEQRLPDLGRRERGFITQKRIWIWLPTTTVCRFMTPVFFAILLGTY